MLRAGEWRAAAMADTKNCTHLKLALTFGSLVTDSQHVRF